MEEIKMKKLVIVLLLTFLPTWIFCEANNSSLEQATSYYNSADYKVASEFYKKAIAEGVCDGVVFYRLGYSLENTQSDNELMKECYRISAYVFEAQNATEDGYYQKASKKEKQFQISHSDINDEYVQKFIKSFHPVPEKKDFQTLYSDTITFLQNMNKTTRNILIAIAVTVYIIAWLFSMGGRCVIVYTWWDMLLLMICGGIFWCGMEIKDPTVEKPYLTLLIIAFLASMVISVIANRKNPFPLDLIFVFVSVMAKLILVVVVPVVLLMVLTAFDSGKKDRRYEDGTYKNKRSHMVALLFILISLLISPLVKTKKNSKVSETVDGLKDVNYAIRFIRRWNYILGA